MSAYAWARTPFSLRVPALSQPSQPAAMGLLLPLLGPWLLAAAMIALAALCDCGAGDGAALDFETVLRGNAAFALVIAGTLVLAAIAVMTRLERAQMPQQAGAAVLLGLALVLSLGIAPALVLYAHGPSLMRGLNLLAATHLLLSGAVLYFSAILIALRDLRAWSLSLAAGAAVVLIAWLQEVSGTADWLLAANCGLLLALSIMTGRVLAQFPVLSLAGLSWRRVMMQGVQPALIGLSLTLSATAAQWMQFWSPAFIGYWHVLPFAGGEDAPPLRALAAASTIPALLTYLLVIEPALSAAQGQFESSLRDGAPLPRLRRRHRALVDRLAEGARDLVLLQGIFSLLVVIALPRLLAASGMLFIAPRPFAVTVATAALLALLLCALAALAQLGRQREVLIISLLFAVARCAIAATVGGVDAVTLILALVAVWVSAAVLVTHVQRLIARAAKPLLQLEGVGDGSA